jgi:cytochrome c oxidase subunit 2
MSSSVFNPNSPQAQAIADLFILILLIGTLILLLVTVLVLYASFRYRRREGDDGEPRQIFGRQRLEIAWTVTPALLLTVILALTIYTMGRADPATPGDGEQADLVITAHQWWWEVTYPKTGVVTANEIHIPTGQKLLTRIESADVIHSFWVPALGRKIDAIPGHPNHLWLEADTPGVYDGTCTEYCGAQHAWMRIQVIAQTPDAFAAWQQQQSAPPVVPTSGEAAKGAQLFQELTCVSCHVSQHIGPNLYHLGSRATIGAGILENTPVNLAKWLTNPQAIKPGVHMPNLNLTQEQISALVAYLEALK